MKGVASSLLGFFFKWKEENDARIGDSQNKIESEHKSFVILSWGKIISHSQRRINKRHQTPTKISA